MATRRYGWTQGDEHYEVTETVGAAVAEDTVELTVDLADGLGKLDVLKALEDLGRYIAEHDWPPA